VTPGDTSGPADGELLTRARLVAAALTGGVLMLTAVSFLFPLGSGLERLVAPAALAGLVSPVIGYRIYSSIRDRRRTDGSRASRGAAFLRATLIALALSEGIALLGIVVFLLSGAIAALTGVLTHVLLAGAVWPTVERLDLFLGRPAATSRES
jgi:dolichol kinase